MAVADLDKGAVETTATAVTALGRKSLVLDADVGDLASIDQMTRRVAETFGHIDIS